MSALTDDMLAKWLTVFMHNLNSGQSERIRAQMWKAVLLDALEEAQRDLSDDGAAVEEFFRAALAALEEKGDT